MPDLEVGNLRVSEGEMETGWIEGVELTTTNQIDIPVMGMNGAEDGPTALLIALQDGVEIQNLPTVHKIMREEVDPADLAGQLIGIPVANPLAFMTATYDTWIDNGNVQAKTIDQPNGGPTERLTHAVWDEAWSQSDLVLNYHSNVRPEALFYQAIQVADDTKDDLERMARAFGLTTIYYEGFNESAAGGSDDDEVDEDDVPLTIRNKSALDGIPELLLETVDGRWISEPSQTINIEGTLNVLKEFDLLEGDAVPGHELHEDKDINLVECRYTGGSGVNKSMGMLTADHGGIIYPKKTTGEPISEGEVVAEITDLHGEVVEEITMPDDGYVWAYPCSQSFGTSGLLQTIEAGGNVAYTFQHVE